MAVRIRSLEVKPDGPLRALLKIDCGDLVVVYGKNESGKSYIVEALLQFLFKSGKQSGWELRDFEPAGSAVVDGLDGGPVKFSRTSSGKLDTRWSEAGVAVPEGFSRLLVVKEGDLSLDRQRRSGVNMDTLKNYLALSSTRALDAIDDRINATYKSGTELGDGHVIPSRKTRLITDHLALRESVTALDRLRERLAAHESFSQLATLRRNHESVSIDHETLRHARRHRSWQLAGQRDEVASRLNRLPGESELTDLLTGVRKSRDAAAQLAVRHDERTGLEKQQDDLDWIDAALEEYDQCRGAITPPATHALVTILCGLGQLVALVSGLFSFLPGVVLGVLATAVCLLLLFRSTRAHQFNQSGAAVELDRIGAAYCQRFGDRSVDRTTLVASREQLVDTPGQLKQVNADITRIDDELRRTESSITSTLRQWINRDFGADEWESLCHELRTARQQDQYQLHALDEQQAQLQIAQSNRLQESPGTEWDEERFHEIQDRLESLDQQIVDTENESRELRDEVVSIVGGPINGGPLEWIDTVEQLHEKQSRQYREQLAGAAAQVLVHQAIQSSKRHEDRLIHDGLDCREVSQPLFQLTGRYNEICFESDPGEETGDPRLVVSEGIDKFPVASLSTGAREQVLLALRLGFASLALGNQPAFLLLDDAFQHADWDRREKMVTQAVELVRSGWQVFYLTMDDHIHKLFTQAGKALGDRFQEIVLE